MSEAPDKIWAMAPRIGKYWSDSPVTPEDHLFQAAYTRTDIADARIAELEAKLEKAVEGLGKINLRMELDADGMQRIARATLEALIAEGEV